MNKPRLTGEVLEEKSALLGVKEEARSSTSSLALSGGNDWPQSSILPARAERKSRLLWLSITLHLLLSVLSVGSLLAVLTLRDQRCLHGPDVIYSPARNAVTYESVFMNNSLEERNPFKAAQPTPEQTDAWRELLGWQLIVLQEEDMVALDRLKENSVKFEDGSGYMGTLDMYHELHCLYDDLISVSGFAMDADFGRNYLREYIHRDYYENRETEEIQVIHVDHCIDTLRQIIMCHADSSIVTYDWVDGHSQPYPNFEVTRECRNWDGMFAYVKSHQPEMYEGALVHPKYGPVPWKAESHGPNSQTS